MTCDKCKVQMDMTPNIVIIKFPGGMEHRYQVCDKCAGDVYYYINFNLS